MRATVALLDGGAQRTVGDWLATTANERRAVVLESPFMALDVPEDVELLRLGGACACCLGQLPLRVALVRLVRARRPHEVLLLVSDPAHVGRVRALLGDGSLGVRFEVP
jgi:hypothetical protein